MAHAASMKHLPAYALLLASLAGCGGGSSDAKASSAEVRPADVATAAGCADTFQMSTTEELFARELGVCRIKDAEVSLYTFASNANRDDWLDVASNFGGMYVVLDRAVISADSRDALEAAKAKAGGELR